LDCWPAQLYQALPTFFGLRKLSKKEMITYFKEHMLKIKDIVEPIIDDELSKELSQ